MLSLCVLYVGILLFKALSSLWVILQGHDHPGAARHHDVTILQPILSGDPELARTLAANLDALPCVRFFWLIDDDDVMARRIAEQLRQYDPLPARIRIMHFPPAPDGVNPKTFKLEGAWRQVETAMCLVLDDDARIRLNSLNALLEAVEPCTLVTALPFSPDGGRWPSQLLAQFVNNNAALAYLPLLPFAGPLSINGMCYALRTDFLTRLGGFLPILRHLTDDLALACLVLDHGGRLCQLTVPVAVQTRIFDGAHYARQMHRWFLFALLLMRRKSVRMNGLIFMLQCVHPLALWGLLIIATRELLTGGVTATTDLMLLSGVIVLRAATLSFLQWRLTSAVRHRPLLSLLSELLQPFHFLHAVLYRRICWRTRQYQVLDNDRFNAR